MISIETPKELRIYNPKFISIFTKRQAVYIGAAIVLDLTGYITLIASGKYSLTDVFYPAMLLNIAVIAMAFADLISFFKMPEAYLFDIIKKYFEKKLLKALNGRGTRSPATILIKRTGAVPSPKKHSKRYYLKHPEDYLY